MTASICAAMRGVRRFTGRSVMRRDVWIPMLKLFARYQLRFCVETKHERFKCHQAVLVS